MSKQRIRIFLELCFVVVMVGVVVVLGANLIKLRDEHYAFVQEVRDVFEKELHIEQKLHFEKPDISDDETLDPPATPDFPY